MDQLGASLGSITSRLRDIWSSQGPAGRIIVGAVGIAIIVGLGVFGFARFRPVSYATLFSNLSPDDANAVVVKLEASRPTA